MDGCYVISLEDNKYYVGITKNLHRRLHSHIMARLGCNDCFYGTKAGSRWTRKYGIKNLVSFFPGENNLEFENYKTIEMMN